jgi:hypothetical protein
MNATSATTLHGGKGQAGDPLALHTPVQFDRTLVSRLLGAHEALNARFAALVVELDRDAPATLPAVDACAEQLHELRRSESMWLYPVLARCVQDDTDARAQLVQLRLNMLTGARRIFRHFEELTAALRTGSDFRAAAGRLSAALAEYLRRNETEIYPLYDFVGARVALAQVQAA